MPGGEPSPKHYNVEFLQSRLLKSVTNHTCNRKRWKLWIVPIAVILTMVSAWLLFLTSCTAIDNTAIYPGLLFAGGGDSYTMVATDDPSNCELYIELPIQGPVAVASITPEMLKAPFRRYKSGSYEHYSCFKEDFYFQNGRLVKMSLLSDNLRFSHRKDGKYLRFPITHSQLVEVFGEPQKSERTRRQVSPSFH